MSSGSLSVSGSLRLAGFSANECSTQWLSVLTRTIATALSVSDDAVTNVACGSRRRRLAASDSAVVTYDASLDASTAPADVSVASALIGGNATALQMVLADALEADLKTSSADSANRVAGLESDLSAALAASGVAQRELVSARAAVRAAADAAEARARETETLFDEARAERDALSERLASAVAERDGSVRDAEETRRSREEATRALETMTRIAETRRARLEEASDTAATVFVARAFALSAFFSMQRLAELQTVKTEAENARDDARDAESRAEGLKADVRRLEAKAVSLETALRETSFVTERVTVQCASLAEQAKKGEEAERVSRLRVAYARECERRLAVAAAEKIRLARALDALGGEDALETRRAAAG